jgi:hypothetical protein
MNLLIHCPKVEIIARAEVSSWHDEVFSLPANYNPNDPTTRLKGVFFGSPFIQYFLSFCKS